MAHDFCRRQIRVQNIFKILVLWAMLHDYYFSYLLLKKIFKIIVSKVLYLSMDSKFFHRIHQSIFSVKFIRLHIWICFDKFRISKINCLLEIWWKDEISIWYLVFKCNFPFDWSNFQFSESIQFLFDFWYKFSPFRLIFVVQLLVWFFYWISLWFLRFLVQFFGLSVRFDSISGAIFGYWL